MKIVERLLPRDGVLAVAHAQLWSIQCISGQSCQKRKEVIAVKDSLYS